MRSCFDEPKVSRVSSLHAVISHAPLDDRRRTLEECLTTLQMRLSDEGDFRTDSRDHPWIHSSRAHASLRSSRKGKSAGSSDMAEGTGRKEGRVCGRKSKADCLASSDGC